MQTFLPHIGWNKSLQSLDDLRLSKQRVEAKQILMILAGESAGYQHHPAVAMWAGFERSLCMYGFAACYQWHIVRKYKCDMYPWFAARGRQQKDDGWSLTLPLWLQDSWFMRSHRSNLIRKDPKHYGKLWPNTPENMPYLWPVNDVHEPYGYKLNISMADCRRLIDGERIMPPQLEFNETNRDVTTRWM